MFKIPMCSAQTIGRPTQLQTEVLLLSTEQNSSLKDCVEWIMLRRFLSLKSGWSPWTKPVWSLSISSRITFSIPANVLSLNWFWAEQTDTVVCSVSWWIGINWHSRGDLKLLWYC